MAVRMSEFPTEATVISSPVHPEIKIKHSQHSILHPHPELKHAQHGILHHPEIKYPKHGSLEDLWIRIRQEGIGSEFVCGWGAASINIVTTFPINKVIFRQQLNGVSTMVALRQLHREGLLYLYRGVLPPLLQKSATLSIMFGAYDKFSHIFSKRFPQVDPRLNHGAAAMLAGCIEATLAPLERVQTLLQDKTYHSRYRNTVHAFYRIGHTYGTQEFFRGMSAVLIRNGPSNVLFFQFRNDIKDMLPVSNSPGGEMTRNFISGGILGAGISTIFFPVNLVKTQMQRKIGGEFTSFYRTLLLVYEERNGSIREMFRGIHVNYTRSVISWGIINASYEIIKSTLYGSSSDSW